MGEFSGMSSQKPRITLQGVRIQSAILKIVFRHILFFLFLMQFRLRRAAAFVSSPIHLLYYYPYFFVFIVILIIIIIIQHLYSAIMSYADTEALVAPVKSE